MTPEQIASYVGKPYQLGGEGPDVYDCRGLLRAVMRDHFGVELPELLSDPAAVYGAAVSDGRWQIVEKPSHGDGVLMRGGNDPHVGVYLEAPAPGILHAWEGARQVVWTPLDRLRLIGFSRVTFVRVTGERLKAA